MSKNERNFSLIVVLIKELEELFLDYWRGASENSFNKNTEIMFQDNKSAVIDWSNGKKPVVSIKTTSNEKQSFICKSDLEDEYSKVDWKEMEKCLNTKVQKSHKCIANQREKCKCITFFQQPLERNEAVNDMSKNERNFSLIVVSNKGIRRIIFGLLEGCKWKLIQ